MCVRVWAVWAWSKATNKTRFHNQRWSPKSLFEFQLSRGRSKEGGQGKGLGKRAADEHEKWLSHCRHVFIHNRIRIRIHNHKWQMQMQMQRTSPPPPHPLQRLVKRLPSSQPPPTTARGRCLLISHDKLQLLGRSKEQAAPAPAPAPSPWAMKVCVPLSLSVSDSVHSCQL